MNKILRSPNLSEHSLDLRSNFQTRVRPLEGPVAAAKPVLGQKPSLLLRDDGRLEVGQLLSLRIEMNEPELEISIDARVTDLYRKANEQWVAADPVRLSADLLDVLARSSARTFVENS